MSRFSSAWRDVEFANCPISGGKVVSLIPCDPEPFKLRQLADLGREDGHVIFIDYQFPKPRHPSNLKRECNQVITAKLEKSEGWSSGLFREAVLLYGCKRDKEPPNS